MQSCVRRAVDFSLHHPWHAPIFRSLGPRGRRAQQAVCWLQGYVMDALAPLGTVSEFPSENQTIPGWIEGRKDYFVERDGQRFAGMHLLLDLWGAQNLRDPDAIERALCSAAEAASATVLHSHFHHFSPEGGVSGVVVLAESHISIHTWPEREFAAIDIFMCGACDPYNSVPVLEAAFRPREMTLDERRRGRLG